MYGSRGKIVRSKFFSSRDDSQRSGGPDMVSKGRTSASGATIPGLTDEQAEGGRVTLNFRKLKDQIAELAPHRNTLIKDLPAPLQEKISMIGKVFGLMYASSFYPNLVGSVRSHFGDVSEVKPGTVGGFFYGCFVPNGYSGPIHCSTECSGSIQPPNVQGWETCNDSVFVLTEQGILESRNMTDSKKAILHVMTPAFNGLTQSQIAEIRQRGIERMDINLVQANSNYVVISQDLSIHDVPVFVTPAQAPQFNNAQPPRARATPPQNNHGHGGRGGKHDDSDDDDDDHHDNNTGSNFSGIIIGIIFLIVIVLVIVVAWRLFSNRRSPNEPEYGTVAPGAVDNPPSGVNVNNGGMPNWGPGAAY